ncbi:hypothetical protein P3W45_001108 [Vairimorpha bombi]
MYKYSNDVYERKISRRNHLVKRVRENYVRKDIPCGFSCCESSKYDTFCVYVIPTKNILEKNKSLLKSDYVRPIICQSVYSKLGSNDQKRIKDIINKRNYVFFYDMFFEDTCNKGLEGILEFYKKHVPNNNFIILSTENIQEYPKYFDNSKDVQDLVDDVYVKEDTLYENYYEDFSCKDLIQSTLMVDTYNWRNGTIIHNNKRIRILGSKNMNRALHGDEVYVELIDELCEDKIDDIKLDDEILVKKDTNEILVKKDTNEILVKKDTNKNSDELFGKVVRIIKRGKTELIATILNNTVNGDGPQNVLALPIDKKYPPVRIRTSQVDELINRRLWIEVEFWDQDSKYPVGHYYKKLNEIGDLEGEVKCILLSNNISYFNDTWIDLFNNLHDSSNIYDTETVKALNLGESDFFSLQSMYKEVEEGKRKDLRHLDIFSIDPQGCTDVDDALHFRELSNGNYEIGVHIADVSHYVKPGSLLDKISSDRGTTVYLPDRRIDMLPEFLSAGLCSLLENQERGSFSVIWEIDINANILSTEFTKALIKSRKAFSYDEALKTIESTGPYKSELEGLYRISKILRNKRQENGALDLSGSKVEIQNGKVVMKGQVGTYELIEEFMLLANISVAKFIYENYPENCILRKHPPPSQTDLPIKIDLQASKNINSVIQDMQEEKRCIFKQIVTRAMNQATYVLSSDTTDFYHYGLATTLYTHFTSPIRRYADILVHRILFHILKQSNNLLSDGEGKRYKVIESSEEMNNVNQDIVSNINRRHSSAKRCAWDVNNLFIYMAIRDTEPETDAYITDIKSNGVLLYIPEFNINEALFIDGDIKYEIFDKLRVKIVKDDECYFYKKRFKLEIVN